MSPKPLRGTVCDNTCIALEVLVIIHVLPWKTYFCGTKLLHDVCVSVYVTKHILYSRFVTTGNKMEVAQSKRYT